MEDTEVKNGIFIKPIKLLGKFKWTQENLNNEILKGTKVSIRTIAFSPSYEKDDYEPEVPWNIIDKTFGVNTNENASEELKKIFGEKVFDFPKTPSLIQYLINFLCDKNSIILDSFAGSGTTAHAVLNLNKQDGGNRKFILVEMEDYAESITAERVKRVINGYADNEGTGGSFSFYELGQHLFDEQHNLNEDVATEKIQQYIWYSETKTTYQPQEEEHLLGTKSDTAYYFYFDKEQLTVLDETFLRKLKTKASQYVIYADVCLLDEKLMDKYHIVFKKIPRDISKL